MIFYPDTYFFYTEKAGLWCYYATYYYCHVQCNTKYHWNSHYYYCYRCKARIPYILLFLFILYVNGIYKFLAPAWIITIATLFNCILTSATYPASWSRAKLFMLFKLVNSTDPNNYRGISVIDSIAKLFDIVLCSRLKL